MRFLIIVFLFFCKSVQSGTFTEGTSNPIMGISNQETITLAPQFLVISTSVGYIGKQMYRTGFFSPIGLLPQQIKKLSPLAYKSNKLVKKKNVKLLACNEKVEKLNQINNLDYSLSVAESSPTFFEFGSNCNFQNSSKKIKQIKRLSNRYPTK